MTGWEDFASMVQEMTVEEKRETLRRLVYRVTWDGRQAQLFFCGDDDASVLGLQMKS